MNFTICTGGLGPCLPARLTQPPGSCLTNFVAPIMDTYLSTQDGLLLPKLLATRKASVRGVSGPTQPERGPPQIE